MAYSKTRNGGTGENRMPEHQIWNGKTQIRIPNLGQTVSSASLTQINQD